MQPAADEKDGTTWKSVRRGAKWGSIVGLVAANAVIWSKSIDTPFGLVYPETNEGMILIVSVGLFAGIGAGIGWLNAQNIGEDEPPPMPPDPFN